MHSGPRKRREAKAPGRLVALGPPRAGGAVWLVGAGPGDPDLLTLKAAKVLQRAEVVVHDGLVPAAILDMASPSARRISVAKRRADAPPPPMARKTSTACS